MKGISAGCEGRSDIQPKYDRLACSFAAGVTRPYAWRLTQLKQVKRMVAENEQLISSALKEDLGRSHFESIVLDILSLQGELDYMIANLHRWMRPLATAVPLVMQPATAAITYEPYGVALIISSYNYPFAVSLSPLIGALCAGNCVMLKPSEAARACERLLCELIAKYLDPACVQTVCGGIETGSSLLNDFLWGKIFFTGSTRVGKIVAAAAAARLTPCSLELGGKSPAIIDESCADVGLAVRRLLWGKCSNAGQTCIAPDYVLCHSSKYDELIRLIPETLVSFYGSHPAQSPDFCRQISEQAAARLKALLDERPGEVIHGGQVDVAARFVAPTLITAPRLDSRLMREEIFGPLLPVIKFGTLEEAVALLRSSEALAKPLALYFFGRSRRSADFVTSRVGSGAVLVNDVMVHIGNPFLPFGGVGSSGTGAYHGEHSFHAFSHRRSVMRRDDHALLDVPARYAPFSLFKFNVVRAACAMPALPPLTLPDATFVIGVAVGFGVAVLLVYSGAMMQ